VSRSIATWNDLISDEQHKDLLRGYHPLDEFFIVGPEFFTLWFFQSRSAFISQNRFKKWSREALNDYVLIPAMPGYVWRTDCFFASHFWRTREDPDPDGETLRLHQTEPEPQTWSHTWADWTCMPQHPRLPPEKKYFYHDLRTMLGVIRNTSFIYFHPPFRPRLWILYEIAEYHLTRSGGIGEASDTKPLP